MTIGCKLCPRDVIEWMDRQTRKGNSGILQTDTEMLNKLLKLLTVVIRI